MSGNLSAFEAEAELFFKDTGFLAPGKSESPCAVGQTDFERHEVRTLIKKAWDAGRRRELSRLQSFVEPMLNPPDNIRCQFCGEDDFDLIGLKGHLEVDCEVWSKTVASRRLFR